MNEKERQALFAELISRYQNELHGYIYAVVRNWDDADDLYQAVCLVLWSKFDLFQPGTSFFAWARETAKNKVGDFVRRRPSPTHVTEQLLDILAGTATDSHNSGPETYLAALRRCREKLTNSDEELIQLRYVEELNTIEIADRLQRLRPSISRSLNRIRRLLFECVEMEVAKQEHPSRTRS
jgi:RNA polymerase sigma-70 factor (ECF subfamily)